MSAASQFATEAEAAAARAATGAGGARADWRRQPPPWLWGVSIVLQIISAAALTAYTFFFVDDFLFLAQARTQPFDLTYLREGLFEHFSPISRVLDRVLVDVAPGSFLFAHCVELALYAAALLAFALVVRTILGTGWPAFAFTIVFGQSIFLLRLLNWWTATANILPATVCSLLALWCYLRWRQAGSWKLLAGSFAAFALALLDYETALLFPVYLAVISLLVLEEHPAPRAWWATLRRERRAWLGYLGLEAAAAVNFYTYYYVAAKRPPLHAVASFLVIALFDTFLPAVAGIKHPAAPAHHLFGIVGAACVMAAATAVTLYLRPRAWRCLAAFVIVFLVTMLPVALTRIAEFGTSVGHVIYYQESLQFMFLVLAAYAMSSHFGGRREPPKGALSRLRSAPRPALVAVGITAVAIYAALFLRSVLAMEHAAWQPQRASAFVQTYLADVNRVRAATGREPVLIDLKIPRSILSKHLWPYTTYGDFFALFNPRIRLDEIARPLYIVTPLGRLRKIRFTPLTPGVGPRSTMRPTLGSGVAAAARRHRLGACVPADASVSWLAVPLARAQRMRRLRSGPSYALRVRFRMPASAPVAVMLLARPGGRGFAKVTHAWQRGAGGQLIPLNFTARRLELIAFRLAPGACVTDVAFGELRYAQP